MKKVHGVLEVIIDVLAVFIVIEAFLRFIGVVDILQQNALMFDYVFIGILALDLLYRYINASDRRAFIKESWIEFLSLFPLLPGMRLFRLFRIIRKSKVHRFFSMLGELLTTNSLHHVLGVVLLLAVVGGSFFYRAEGTSLGITIGDSIWFAFVTMTTVGYGDITPVTFSGRLIALMLMIIGIGFLGILTGNIASFFMNRRAKLKSRSLEKKQLDVTDLNDEEIEMVHDYIAFIRHKRR